MPKTRLCLQFLLSNSNDTGIYFIGTYTKFLIVLEIHAVKCWYEKIHVNVHLFLNKDKNYYKQYHCRRQKYV